MKTTIRVSTVMGVVVFRVKSAIPIIDVTGTKGRAVLYEQPHDRYYCLLTVGGSIYPCNDASPRKALKMACKVVYKERKPGGPPSADAVFDDLEPLIAAVDDAIEPKDREFVE